jgi:hypothetical protein
MRIYALLLGVVFTSAYGYAADVAVSSARGGRHSDSKAAATAAAADPTDRIWYGGVLDPITVESGRGDSSAKTTAVSKSRLFDRPAVRCFTAAS